MEDKKNIVIEESNNAFELEEKHSLYTNAICDKGFSLWLHKKFNKRITDDLSAKEEFEAIENIYDWLCDYDEYEIKQWKKDTLKEIESALDLHGFTAAKADILKMIARMDEEKNIRYVRDMLSGFIGALKKKK